MRMGLLCNCSDGQDIWTFDHIFGLGFYQVAILAMSFILQQQKRLHKKVVVDVEAAGECWTG